jgi:non-homologous end joining protein Ku
MTNRRHRMAKATGPRSYANDVSIQLGIASVRGKLLPIKRTAEARDASVFLTCPECNASKVSQLYVGADCGHLPSAGTTRDPRGWSVGEIPNRGRINDAGDMEVVSKDSIAEANKSGLPKNVLSVQVHPASQVAASTFPSGSSYWFEPEHAKDPFQGLLVAALSTQADRAFVGEMNLRDEGDKFFRLVPHNGGFILQELLRPEGLWDFSGETVEPSPAEQEMFSKLVEMVERDFDPAEIKSERYSRILELFQRVGDVNVAPSTPVQASTSTLLDALAASLAVAKSKTAPKAKGKKTA